MIRCVFENCFSPQNEAADWGNEVSNTFRSMAGKGKERQMEDRKQDGILEAQSAVRDEAGTAAWESPSYFQRVEDREQERYLAEWSKKHPGRKSRREP